MIKAVLFDFDGTLMDTEPVIKNKYVPGGNLTVVKNVTDILHDNAAFTFRIAPKNITADTAADLIAVAEANQDSGVTYSVYNGTPSLVLSTGDMAIEAYAESIHLEASTGSIRLDKVSAGAVDITTSTGRIAASDLNCAGVLEVHVSTGKTELKNVRCESFRSTGSTGDLMMENVIAADIFFIRRSTGHVSFDGCDASQITVETDTGDVRGTLCSDKLFRVETDTGDILVPDSTSGGSCRITTSTGDIILETE